MAELVTRAIGAEDLSAFTELLDPDVTWGARSSQPQLQEPRPGSNVV